MADQRYTASKAQTQGRPGWTISFRHPLRHDLKGRPGLKMRRGLGTADAAEADKLVVAMNTLLGDEAWWNAAKRLEAEKQFPKVITDAFFGEIQAGRADPFALREKHIALPGASEGYSRVLLVGTTGAGKTSLLRHLIGSDPDADRFPSTSTAKTTVSDIEVVLSDGPYSAVVTFFSEFWVQANIEECVADACNAVWEQAADARIAERLLNHRDQRFRLSYTLGSWNADEDEVEEDDWAFDSVEASPIHKEEAISAADRDANLRALRGYVRRIRDLSNRTIKRTSKELKVDVLTLNGGDAEVAQEFFEIYSEEDADYLPLIHDIMDDVRRRFDALGKGDLRRQPSQWPDTWTFETDDRREFIEQIRWFSSNYAPQFGKLLSPLVDGIRVRGPLLPTFTKRRPNLVLLDGQGLGHTPDMSASVTTHITKRFADVDVVLLVDSAQQPMQAAPLSVFRAVAVSGHQQKLAVAFTHFDQVKGINLPSFAAKRQHVMASVTNGLSSLKDTLGAPVIRSIERSIQDQCFMLGAMDQPSANLPKGVLNELDAMLNFFERAIKPPAQPETHPIYNPDGLVLALQGAALGFRRPWAARLGLAAHDSAYKEHWTRIKALNRRIAGEFGIEYDTLRPVADLLARLSEQVSRFLDNPIAWTAHQPSEEEAEAALSGIRKTVYAGLHALAERRLIHSHLSEWRAAYDYRGQDSTMIRARDINTIYEEGAPIASTVISNMAAEFIQEMRQLVHGAIKERGGQLAVPAAE